MKAIFSILLLSISFQLNIAMAIENIIGTWQGELPIDSGKKVTLRFLIQQDIDGDFSVVLSLPAEAGTGNIEASSLVFRSGKLTFEVPELSGSYDGILTDGEIVGQWQQEGEFIPLTLSRFELLPLSDEDKEKLLGKWYGKDCPPRTIGGGGAYLFEFEVDEGKNITGVLKVYLPDGKLDPTHHKINEIGKNGDDFIFNEIIGMDSEFRGRIVGNEIVGVFTQRGWPRTYTITKGKYCPDLDTKSDLHESVVQFLSGIWSGEIKLKPNEHFNQFHMLFEFEETEGGDVKAHIIIQEQFDQMFPITEATINNEKLILKAEDFEVQFEMKLSGNTLTGEWTQCGVSYPLTVAKEGS
jgi:hypothetical protein